MAAIIDRATPMLNNKINENNSESHQIVPKIFNFNFHKYFDSLLAGHLEYFEVIDTHNNQHHDHHIPHIPDGPPAFVSNTTVFVDAKAKTLAWGTKVPSLVAGVQLRMATVPGSIYHVFTTGQLFLGSHIDMRIQNKSPLMYLNSDAEFKIGGDESKSFCFRALSHQTDLIMVTPPNCSYTLGPFGFTLKYLTIIPDCIMCKGYVEGGTGPTGLNGPPGSRGNNGLIIGGALGNQGFSGFQGLGGDTGLDGHFGLAGPQGIIGDIGSPNFVTGSQGNQGSRGLQGFSGIIGAMGAQGVQGFVGARGFRGLANTVTGLDGFQGNVGFQGNQGFVGDKGVDIDISEFSGDDFVLQFTKGGDLAVTTFASRQISSVNTATLSMAPFDSVDTGLTGNLISAPLPASIQPVIKNYLLGTAIVTQNTPPLPPVARSVLMEINPSNMIIYSDLTTLGAGFGASDTVSFDRQSFTYLLN